MQNENQIFAPQPGSEPDSGDESQQEQPEDVGGDEEAPEEGLKGGKESPQEETDEEEQFDPQELLVYDHPERENINRLIKQAEERNEQYQGISELKSPHDRFLQEILIEDKDGVDSPEGRLARQINEANQVINLGGGFMEMSKEFDYKVLIGVDKYPESDNSISAQADKVHREESDQLYAERQIQGGTKEFVVKMDMLDFVSRLPDDSNEFLTINGIDQNIVEDEEYVRTLAMEIVRTTKPGGMMFGVDSFVFEFIKNDERVEEIQNEDKHYIFKKNEEGEEE